jgi:hypothetical protein
MNRTLSITLALVAGLAGGLLARYIAPSTAFAQNRAPVTREIRAQSFTLVDQMDRTVGTFMVEGDWLGSQTLKDRQVPISPGRIVLRDSSGREIWSVGGSIIRPLSENIR